MEFIKKIYIKILINLPVAILFSRIFISHLIQFSFPLIMYFSPSRLDNNRLTTIPQDAKAFFDRVKQSKGKM